jgi:5,6,7,8-tetrahydromethanopterin hydro-lyase
MPVIDRVLVGESLVIEDGDLDNVAHIDLIMGPRGSAAEDAFCRTVTDQKAGVNGLLAVIAPNLMVKPATVMFNKVTIKNMKQAIQMFGPAQRGVAMAVADCVEDGTIPANEADDIFLCVGVFIAPSANDDQKIQDWNFRATKESIKRAVAREPKAADVLAQRGAADHPFDADH